MEKLKEKMLPENVQKKVDEAHVECKIEAERKFFALNQVLNEVDGYTECMDFHLAMLCNIQIKEKPLQSAKPFHGVHGLASQSPSNYHHLANREPMGHDYTQVMNRINILAQALKR